MFEIERDTGGFAVYTKFLPRIRHARGYGIHSPLVYSLIRNVFMKKHIGEDTEIYDKIMETGTVNKVARDIQNFYDFYGFSGFSVNGVIHPVPGGNHLYVFSGSHIAGAAEDILSVEWEKGNVVCLMPGKSKERRSLCRTVAGGHPGVSIDRKTYFLYFYNVSYEKQHYKL